MSALRHGDSLTLQQRARRGSTSPWSGQGRGPLARCWCTRVLRRAAGTVVGEAGPAPRAIAAARLPRRRRSTSSAGLRALLEVLAPTDAYRISALVDDLVELVAALGERQAILIGHDWGAPIGVVRGLATPARVPRRARHERAVLGSRAHRPARQSVRRAPAARDPPGHRGSGQDFYQVYFAALGPVIDEIEQDLRASHSDGAKPRSCWWPIRRWRSRCTSRRGPRRRSSTSSGPSRCIRRRTTARCGSSTERTSVCSSGSGWRGTCGCSASRTEPYGRHAKRSSSVFRRLTRSVSPTLCSGQRSST